MSRRMTKVEFHYCGVFMVKVDQAINLWDLFTLSDDVHRARVHLLCDSDLKILHEAGISARDICWLVSRTGTSFQAVEFFRTAHQLGDDVPAWTDEIYHARGEALAGLNP